MTSRRLPYCCYLYSPHRKLQFVLESCKVKVLIADVHASVEISQKFKNPEAEALDAVYTFGLLADAAVCGFEMVREDGTKIEGVVKEKAKAKKEYEEAVKKGYTASLGSEETKDVFSISLGNIPRSETVTINLRYLQTLKDDEKKDQVRFTFPRTYAQRYGQAPTTSAGSFRNIRQPFTLDAVIQQSGTIKGVSCLSGHPMQLELGKPEGVDVEPSTSDSQFAKVSIHDKSGFLTQDVVIVVTASDLDSPRCFIESHPSPEHDTVAMGLTFVPRFKLPDSTSGMEYIFVVDRSGSMNGSNIELVREALVVLLRGLPTKGTFFNIFSFGTSTTKLWDVSQAYTQGTLDDATKHVDTMSANYGGTEIAAALQLVYGSLQKPLGRPVSVFLLTDGSAWDVSTCVDHTHKALTTQATPDNFIRVFTVGIGDGASSDTCDNIAKAGDGFSIYVAPNEPMDLEVLWTGNEPREIETTSEDDFEMVDEPAVPATSPKAPSASISLFDDTSDDAKDVGPPPKPKIVLPPTPKIQQAPLNLGNLFPGTRSQMYAIITGKQTSIPASIKVRGVVATTGAKVELDVPVRHMVKQDKVFLHTLAAKALITDRENKAHAFPASVASKFAASGELRDGYLEKDIVRLGTEYGLSSRHTSFVAVDRRSNQVRGRESEIKPPSSQASRFHVHMGSAPGGGSRIALRAMSALASSSNSSSYKVPGARARMSPMVLPAPRPVPLMAAPFSPKAMQFRSSEAAPPPAAPVHSAYSLPAAASPSTPRTVQHPPPAPARSVQSDELVRNMLISNLNARGPADEEEDEDEPQLSLYKGRGAAFASSGAYKSDAVTLFDRYGSSLKRVGGQSAPPKAQATVPVTSMTEGARLAAVARLQEFNGGFKFSSDLLRLLGVASSDEQFKQKCGRENVDVDLAVTVLALAWLESKGGEETLDLLEKASEWLEERLGSETDVAWVKSKVLGLFSLN